MSRQRVYSLRTRQIAVDLVNELQEKGSCLFKGTEIKSLRQLANSLDVRDESTLRYWARKGDWSRSATTERIGNRGVLGKLNEEEEKKVESFVLHCESSKKHCGIEEVISFCEKEFDWKPSSSWVSKFLKSKFKS